MKMRLGAFGFAVVASLLANVASATTGDAVCLDGLCVTGLLDGGTETYLLTSSSSVGWMAIGFGYGMEQSPMVITWPNSDGTFTISQRLATEHAEPQVVSNPPRIATLSKGNSTIQAANTTIAFTLPHSANSPTTVNLIYAISSNRPSSSDSSAEIIQHDEKGLFPLDLTKPLLDLDITPVPEDGEDEPLTAYQRKIVVHGALATTGFLVLLPIGAIIGRYRVVNPWWFKLHYFVQLALAGPIIFAALAVGVSIVNENRGSHFQSKHEVLGLTLFLMYIVQLLLGLTIHYAKPAAPRRRPPQNYVHGLVGIIILIIAFYNVHLGYSVQWPDIAGHGPAPSGVGIAWTIWVIVVPVAYGAGLILLKRQFRAEEAKLQSYRMIA